MKDGFETVEVEIVLIEETDIVCNNSLNHGPFVPLN